MSNFDVSIFYFFNLLQISFAFSMSICCGTPHSFRAKYVDALKSRIPSLDKGLVDALFQKDWVVYAKRPFAHPSHVVAQFDRNIHGGISGQIYP
jgi:hypothetical protein